MRILVTGASGLLGRYILKQLSERSEAQSAVHQVTGWTGSTNSRIFGTLCHSVDFSNLDLLSQAITDSSFDVVIHAGAMSRVGQCWQDPAAAEKINTQATRIIAEQFPAGSVVYISTDLVFDGKAGPYDEIAPVSPLSCYGQTKHEGERPVIERGGGVIRVSLMFGRSLGPTGSFYDVQRDALMRQTSLNLFVDEWRTPLYLGDAAAAAIVLAESETRGLFHLGGPERLSRFDMGLRLAQSLGVSDDCIARARRETVHAAEPRPEDVSLDSAKWLAAFTGFTRSHM